MSRKKREDPIKALVVDDEEKWRKAITMAMEQLGCEVRKVEDAQTAIDLLRSHPDINVLVLDWDLRQGSSIGTALGEDVLREVSHSRPDLMVVIVTGAFDNPDYTDWREQLGIQPTDEIFEILKAWRPFDLIAKKDLVSGSDLESELKNGLPSLTRRLEERGLIEDVQRRRGLKPVPPYQFHWPSGKLVAGNGIQFTLPLRFELVIREMVDRDPLNPKAIKTELSYEDVATKYTEGWIRKHQSNMNPNELREQIRKKSLQIQENPTKIAHQFASDLRRHLKNAHAITDRDAIIKCDETNQLYTLGESWNQEKPVLDHAEAGLSFQEQVRLADSRNGADDFIADDADDLTEED